jgi:hypothetical protein
MKWRAAGRAADAVSHAVNGYTMPIDRVVARDRIAVQVLVAASLWAAVAVHQGYDFDWDILNYHFYNGFAFVHGRVFANVQPAMLQTYFAPLMDGAFYVLVRWLPPTAVLMIIAVWESLAFPLLFRLSGRLLGGRFRGRAWLVALLVTVLGAAAPISLWEAGSPRGDSTTAMFIVAALRCLTAGFPRTGAPGPAGSAPGSTPGFAAVAGALVGIATGLKLTNAPYGLGLIAALAVQIPAAAHPQARRACYRACAAAACAMAITFLLCYGWWGLMLYRHLGNPVFPNFNQVFRSPYAAPVSYADPAFALPTWHDKLWFPFVRNSVLEPLDPAGLFDLRMAIAVPLCALALLVAPFKKPAPDPGATRARALELALLAFTLASYAAWLLVFPVNRYLVALDLVAPLASVVAVSRLRSGTAAPLAIAAAMALLLPLSAYRTLPLFWLPGDHRHGDAGGYFGVRFAPPPHIGGGVVAMAGDRPTTFVIPFFPRDTVFVRLQGSLQYPVPGFDALSAASTPAARQAVFGNAMGAAICQRLDQANGNLFLLHLAPGDTPHDKAALAYFGVQDAPGPCTAIRSKAAMDITLCPARRMPGPQCQAGGKPPAPRRAAG